MTWKEKRFSRRRDLITKISDIYCYILYIYPLCPSYFVSLIAPYICILAAVLHRTLENVGQSIQLTKCFFQEIKGDNLKLKYYISPSGRRNFWYWSKLKNVSWTIEEPRFKIEIETLFSHMSLKTMRWSGNLPLSAYES